MTSSSSAMLKVREWRARLLYSVAALLVFETITGLAIYLLPFSVPNQWMVVFHTVAGVAFLLPYAWYQARHWKMYRSIRVSHVVLTGYFAMVATVVLIASGLVLTIQAIAGTRIWPAWDLAHLWSTYALIASVTPHVVTLIVRASRARAATLGQALHAASRRFQFVTLMLSAALFVPVLVATVVYRPTSFANQLPADYSYAYGKDRPFAPSLARTVSGGAYDAKSLAGSESCGTSGCHKEIYAEWQVSAHRYAAMDPAFQKVQATMGEQNGPESTRYCGGCHDPISLFSGTKNIFTNDLTGLAGYKEGVSCVSCHAIKETDVKGNAAYVMSQPKRYLFELSGGAVPKAMSDFLIRAYPRYHVQSLQHKLFKSPEFCAACHKQFIDEEINRVGWVQLQNQYDNWRKSRWNHGKDARKTVECRECHMPLLASEDPGSGDDLDYNRAPNDGKHRSHRFLGANQFIPLALNLPGAAEHSRLTDRWLRGEIEVPEIADKWRNGPAVPIELAAPATARPGERVTIQTTLTNNKPGHDFPTGPLDIIQAWVEIRVTDQRGRVVFASGQRDSANFIAPGSFMLKAEPVDENNNLIDRHNLWEMVGVRYRRSLFPGFSDQEKFTFAFPSTHVTELQVTARLMYRKVDQYLLNFLFGKESGMTSPVTVLSEDRKTIRVTAGHAN
ncbi:MAG TPA: multiheme c-type cytochrome [Gemmatimonadaceae bacterium]|nr:multiheme c-type cytochrome [Gemmatimonadaceae bacterium]